jgi:hypothetical protein
MRREVQLARPSESSAVLLGRVRSRNRPSSYGVRRSSRVFVLRRYRPYGFDDPDVPLAVSPALRSSRSRLPRSPFSDRMHPLFEFRAPLESYPASPSRSAAAIRLLSWTLLPFSTYKDRRSASRGHAGPPRSAFRVWLPSWRFPPCDPGPALFHAGSAPGICPFRAFPCRGSSRRFRRN